MQQAWALKDEIEWEKIRLQCYFSGNSQFLKKPVKDVESIVYLPSIDGELEEAEDQRAKIDRRRAELFGK